MGSMFEVGRSATPTEPDRHRADYNRYLAEPYAAP